MFYECLKIAMLSLAFATLLQAQPVLVPTDVHVPRTCLVGASIPVDFSLDNASDMESGIRFDAWGIPMDLVSLSDSTGKLIKRRDLPGRARVGPGFPDRDDEFCSLRPAEKIRLSYDLAAIYDISSPGKYQLRMRGSDRSFDFECHAYKLLESRDISGRYQSPWTVSQVTGSDCSMRVSIAESNEPPAARRFLLIDRLEVANDRIRPLYNPSMPVETDSTIRKCEIDFLGQLWVVLGSGGKNSLLLWRVDSISWSILIEPTQSEIELRTTRARSYIRDINVVIGGIRGAEQLTSYAVTAGVRK